MLSEILHHKASLSNCHCDTDVTACITVSPTRNYSTYARHRHHHHHRCGLITGLYNNVIFTRQLSAKSPSFGLHVMYDGAACHYHISGGGRRADPGYGGAGGEWGRASATRRRPLWDGGQSKRIYAARFPFSGEMAAREKNNGRDARRRRRFMVVALLDGD